MEQKKLNELLQIAITLGKTKAEELIDGLVGKITKGKRILKFRAEKEREIAELKKALAETNQVVANLSGAFKAHLQGDVEALEEICLACEEGLAVELEEEDQG